MPTFKSDYAFGSASEKSVLPTLNAYFNSDLLYRGGNSTFDYDNGSNLFVELKTRRITHDQYPTAIIGANKVDSASKHPEHTYWFVYQYADGLYGVKYDKDLFATFERRSYSRGDRPDFHNRPQECVFLPHKHLTKLA